MKKILTFLTAMLIGVNAFACWFTSANYNRIYIAGVNYYFAHYDGKAENIESVTFQNGQKVSLPLVCWFKIEPRIISVNGVSQQYSIRQSALLFKVIPAGQNDSVNNKWYLAKTLSVGLKNDKPAWVPDFGAPVKLFGGGTLTKQLINQKLVLDGKQEIKSGDKIVFVWFISDFSPTSSYNTDEFQLGQNGNINPSALTGSPVLTTQNSQYKLGDILAPYFMVVEYNGRKTPGR